MERNLLRSGVALGVSVLSATGPPPRRRFRNHAKVQLDESLHEVECRLCHLAPAAVDRERVAAVRDPGDLGDGLVVLLALVGGVGDRPRDGVVLLALDDQQRAAVGDSWDRPLPR